MHVKAVSITQPLVQAPADRYLTADEFIVYAARVSNPSNQLNTLTAPGLINYCIKHQHWSIFEQCSLGVEIVTSRAIAQQILRHKSFSFQEFSQRYSEATAFEPIELRAQAEKNRQSSTELIESEELSTLVSNFIKEAEALYKKLLDSKVAKECARFILPSTTQTTLYMTGTVRSWIHYIELRSKPDTQKEHRDVALGAKREFVHLFPMVAAALGWTSDEKENRDHEQRVSPA